jgi:hypothetical protein
LALLFALFFLSFFFSSLFVSAAKFLELEHLFLFFCSQLLQLFLSSFASLFLFPDFLSSFPSVDRLLCIFLFRLSPTFLFFGCDILADLSFSNLPSSIIDEPNMLRYQLIQRRFHRLVDIASIDYSLHQGSRFAAVTGK